MMDRTTFQSAKCIYDFMSSCPPAPAKADFILVLGSHDLRVPDYAATLFLSGVAPLMICSGGYGKGTDGIFAQPEGTLFAERCMEKGVPQSAIIIENKAANTGENFTFSRAIMTKMMGICTGIVVCKPYMAKRAMATGIKQWPEVRWGVSVQNIPFEQYSPSKEMLNREIEIMVGDLQRLKFYAENGFQAPVDIPEYVWSAYHYLVHIGYNKYIIPGIVF